MRGAFFVSLQGAENKPHEVSGGRLCTRTGQRLEETSIGGKPTTTPEPASLPAAQLAAQPKETATAQSRIDKVTKTLIGTWEGQSDQVRLMMEFGADRTIIESADPGGGWKPVNKGTWKVVEAEGDAVTLEINPTGKPSYRQTDVFDGSDKFHHKHGDKVIPFVRK